jgi:hypothetical protein
MQWIATHSTRGRNQHKHTPNTYAQQT